MASKYNIKTDSEGFLVGRGGKDVLQAIADDASESLRILKGGRTVNKSVVNKSIVKSARQSPKVNQSNAAGVRKTANSQISALVKKPIKVTSIVKEDRTSSKSGAGTTPLRGADGRFMPKEGRKERETKSFRAKTVDNSRVQTAILKKVAKELKNGNSRGGGSGGGLLGKVAGIAGISRMLLGGGALRMGGGLLGGLMKGGAVKGLAKGGILGALMAGYAGMNVENSNLSRGNKNKQHFKNIIGSGGGIAGAMAGAAIGQAIIPIPVVGAVVGAVAGGLFGTKITDAATDAIDKRFDPKTSEKMFSSWANFTSTAKSSAKDFWSKNAPDSWQKMTKSISDFAANTLDGIKTKYQEVKENVANSAPVQAISRGVEATKSAISNSAPVRWAVDFGSGLTNSKDGITYKMGGKDYRDGTIDCSGWVSALNKDVSGQIQRLLGNEAAKDVRINAAGGAAGIIQTETKKGRAIADAARWSDLDMSKLKSGMIVGEARGTHAKGRYKNIGHIGTIIEENGKKYFSESTSEKGKDGKSGVRKTELSEYIKNIKNKRKGGDNFAVYVVDPYKDYRSKIGKMDEQNTVAYQAGNVVSAPARAVGSMIDTFSSNRYKNYSNNKIANQTFANKNRAQAADDVMRNFKGGKIGNLSADDSAAFAALVSSTESGFNYSSVNQHGYAGAYQMGAAALEDIGLVKKGTAKRGNKALRDPSVWNIKGGMNEFLKNRNIQDKAFVDYTNKNISYLRKNGVSDEKIGLNGDFGALAYAMKATHLKGHSGGAKLLKYGIDSKDANGQSAKEYGRHAKEISGLFLSASKTVRSNFKQPQSIQPVAVKTPVQSKGNGNSNNAEFKNNTLAVMPYNVAHKPTEQTVSNKKIAHISSGHIHG